MFTLDDSGKIKVSQGDTFAINVISSIPFQNKYTDENGKEHPSDIVTLTVKKELDTADIVIEKVITEFTQCPKNEDQYIATINFTSMDTCKDVGNYYYDIQFDYVEKNIRYTAMYPTRFVIVEDVTNNKFEMTPIETPKTEEGDTNG